jgi:hypothetical protein
VKKGERPNNPADQGIVSALRKTDGLNTRRIGVHGAYSLCLKNDPEKEKMITTPPGLLFALFPNNF